MKTGRKKRNWAGRVLLGVLLAALLSMNVYAQSDYSEGYFIYRDHGTYVSIKEYFGEESRVEIPAALGGKPVAEIEEDAFAQAATVQELVIPNTVVTIGEGALDSVERVVYETGEDPEKESRPNPKPEENTQSPEGEDDSGTDFSDTQPSHNDGKTAGNETEKSQPDAGAETPAVRDDNLPEWDEDNVQVTEDGYGIMPLSEGGEDTGAGEQGEAEFAAPLDPADVTACVVLYAASAVILGAVGIYVKKKKLL